MKKLKIKKIILAILTLQIGLYLLIGDFMLEKQIFNEFEEFSKRRLANEYNVENGKVWEEFYFSSCGDDFFRNYENLEQKVRNTNPKRYGNIEKYLSIENSEFYKNPLVFYNEKIYENEEVNIIRFGACRINRIPFLKTKIELKESFSTHNDFHTMIYTDQMLTYKVNYIWVIFKWVRISKEKENF
jgi:hypothetical protein|tara:strand:+ start:49 stop:606 length:558 start_codon:yes stop_codon:yes gene_type:complete